MSNRFKSFVSYQIKHEIDISMKKVVFQLAMFVFLLSCSGKNEESVSIPLVDATTTTTTTTATTATIIITIIIIIMQQRLIHTHRVKESVLEVSYNRERKNSHNGI